MNYEKSMFWFKQISLFNKKFNIKSFVLPDFTMLMNFTYQLSGLNIV